MYNRKRYAMIKFLVQWHQRSEADTKKENEH